MIQANPTITTLRRAWMVMPIALAGIVVLIVLLFATALLFNYSYSFSIIAYLFLVLAGGIITLVITILQGRYWQRIEQRRFAAVQGEQTLLAAEQPTPNAASLQLPITIKLRYRKESLPLMQGAPIMIAMLLGLLVVFADLLALVLPLSSPHHAPLLVPIATFFTFLILGMASAVYLSRLSSQQLDVAEDGLTSHSMGQASSLRWNEARLFARYGTFGAQKSGAALTYELSSAGEIMRWTWVRHKTYPVGLESTILPDEYNRQMEALLSLVAAKTGLALYDLSGVRS